MSMKKISLLVCALFLTVAGVSARELVCEKFFSGSYLKNPNADVTITHSSDGTFLRYIVPADDKVADEIREAVEKDGAETTEKTVKYSKGKLYQYIVTFPKKSGRKEETIVFSPIQDGKSIQLTISKDN